MSLARQELAELVNTWVWEHYDKTVVVTAHYIGRLETGIIRWPTALYREALRVILGVPTDAALGFVNACSRRVADNFRELSHHAAAHQQLDEVAHLRHRIATLLVGADSP